MPQNVGTAGAGGRSWRQGCGRRFCQAGKVPTAVDKGLWQETRAVGWKGGR